MVEVTYSKKFIRMFKMLDPDVQDQATAAIERFKDSVNHKSLSVHKLHGKFKGAYAFSVSRKRRISFEYTNGKKDVVLLTIGDHDIYR